MTSQPLPILEFTKQFNDWCEQHKQEYPTQKALARHCAVSKTSISEYLSGKVFPSEANIKNIYRATQLEILKPFVSSSSQIPFQGVSENNSADQDNLSDDDYSQQQTVKNQDKRITNNIENDNINSNNSSNANTTFSLDSERQELYIPIFGFVWLYPEEIRILNHSSVQRLGRINQLGLSYLVYRGATHTRLEHSIGTVHVAQRMINAVKHTSEKASTTGRKHGASIQQLEERFIRLGALLHDVGHIVSGHTIEDQLGLICKHDSDERLDTIFSDPEGLWSDTERLSLEKLINREYQKYIPQKLLSQGLTAAEIVRLLIRKPPQGLNLDRYQKQQTIMAESTEIRLNICRDIIGNTICADILDYLHRDWYHIGKSRTFDDRIFQYMEIYSKDSITNDPTPKASDQFVLSLGNSPKIRTDAVSQVLEFLEWRYQLAESVLFHRTKLAAEAMLERALFSLWGTDKKLAEKTLLTINEDEIFRVCKDLAHRDFGEDSIAYRLLGLLEKRQIFTSLITLSYYDLIGEVKRRIQKHYSPGSDSSTVPAYNRNRILNLLENDFQLTPGSIAMFCPSDKMQAKVAQVKIVVGDEVDSFSDYEKNNDNSLSAGHLAAQIKRFERLWRVHFFIDRSEKERIGAKTESLLRDAITELALGVVHTYEQDKPEAIAQNIAESLVSIEAYPYHGKKVREKALTAASGAKDAATGMYPFGAPSIISYIDYESD